MFEKKCTITGFPQPHCTFDLNLLTGPWHPIIMRSPSKNRLLYVGLVKIIISLNCGIVCLMLRPPEICVVIDYLTKSTFTKKISFSFNKNSYSSSLQSADLPNWGNSGPTSSGAMTYFMIGRTSSIIKLVLATIKNVR